MKPTKTPTLDITSCKVTETGTYQITGTNSTPGNSPGAFFRLVKMGIPTTGIVNFPFLADGQSGRGSSVDNIGGTTEGGTWIKQYFGEFAWISIGTCTLSDSLCS